MYARQHALDHADQAAFIMATSGDTITFGDLNNRAERFAALGGTWPRRPWRSALSSSAC